MIWFVSAALIAIAPGASAPSQGPSSTPAMASVAPDLARLGSMSPRPTAAACDPSTVREVMARHRTSPTLSARLRRGATSDYRSVGTCQTPLVMDRLPAQSL
jgi:hypothetical protein